MIEEDKKRTLLWLSSVAAFVLTTPPTLAEIIFVPSQYATIQSAIDAAENSDVVEIADGTYVGTGNKNLDFRGKAITVRSESGDPSLCIIDCEGDGRGFYFHNEENPASVVEGFAIRNGRVISNSPGGAYGGGVHCSGSSPTFTNCVISCNSAWNGGGIACCDNSSPSISSCSINANSANDGGGLYCTGSSAPTISNCIISCNPARNGGGIACYDNSNASFDNCKISKNSVEGNGGGIFSSNSSPTLTTCTIHRNSTIADYGYGGGAYCCSGGVPILNECIISENSASSYGGGICSGQCGLSLNNCTIRGNTAKDGGGIRGIHSDPTLVNCMVIGNTASNNGGGICCDYNCNPVLDTCTIKGNTASREGGGFFGSNNASFSNCTISENFASNGGGGGVYSQGDDTLTNCTISRNSSKGPGGGVYCFNGDVTLTNCVVTKNTASQGGGVYCSSSSVSTLTNCILWGDTPDELGTSYGEISVTYSNIQGSWPGNGNIDTDPQFTFTDDFHISPNSPCIDAGTNGLEGTALSEDADGNVRPLDGNGDGIAMADMGIYEFNPTIPSVATSPMLLEFTAAKGGSNPASQTLLLRNCGGETLYWEIYNNSAWLTVDSLNGESTGEVDEVTLSVDIDELTHGMHTTVLEITDPQAANSPREVIVKLYITDTIHVPNEYPTIQAAIDAAVNGDIVEIANGTYTGEENKNLDFRGKAITVRSVSLNASRCIIDCGGDGRGFYFFRGEGPESIVQALTITNGRVWDNGGGVYCSHSSPKLINNIISYNTAAFDGGGVYCRDSSNPILINCKIHGNSANNGAGVSGNGKLTNCAISYNTANGQGGGIYCYEDSILTNCTFTRNTASEGGGIYCSNATLTNCILWDDVPEEIHAFVGSSPSVVYSNIQGGWVGTGNIDIDPQFAFENDFHLLPDSPCIDAGSNSLPVGISHSDLDGNDRLIDGDENSEPIIDMGVYEFDPQAPSIAVSPVTIEFVVNEGETNTTAQSCCRYTFSFSQK